MATVKYFDPSTGQWLPVGVGEKGDKGDKGDQGAPGNNVSIVTKEVPTGLVNNTNKTFTTSQPYVGGSLQARINGVAQDMFITETSPSTGVFNFDIAPFKNDKIAVSYQTAVSGTVNSDTVDNYHASATPTVNTIPVLNSSAQMPVSTLPFTKTVDANGWTVYDYGTWKEYRKKGSFGFTIAAGAWNSGLGGTGNLPVGMATIGSNFVEGSAGAGDAAVTVDIYQQPDYNKVLFMLSNQYTGSVSNTVYWSICITTA